MNHTHAIPVWVYWEGKRSPIINLCIKTIERWNPSTIVVTPDNIGDLGGEHILEQTEGMRACFRSDLLRCWLLHEYGGVWVDADCVALSPIEFLPIVPDFDLIGTFNKHQNKGWGQAKGVLATPVAGCKGSPIWAEAIESVSRSLEQMKAGKHIPYGQTSVGIASQLYKAHNKSPRVKRFEHWKFNPVPWYKSRDVYFRTGKPYQHEMHYGAWYPNACLYHLTNVVTKTWEDRPEREILGGPSFVSFLINKGLSRKPAIFPRSVEIAKRLPQGPCCMTEVGVLKGMNARHVMQQHKQVRMTLVDRWAVHPQGGSFRKSGDYMASWGQPVWDKIFREVVPMHLKFAGDRWKTIRAASVEGAKQVEDNSQDLVFIDGDHSYAGVKADILAWYPKVKPGGWIGGHDFNSRKNKTGKYGINRAVQELVRETGQPLETGLDMTWFIRKPN